MLKYINGTLYPYFSTNLFHRNTMQIDISHRETTFILKGEFFYIRNDIINLWNELEELGLPKIVVKEKFDGFKLGFASVLPIIQLSNSLGTPIPLSETILCNYIL